MGFTPVTANAFESDIESVVRTGHQDSKALRYSVILHTVDSDITITLLESVEVLRDYVNNITDYILVNFKMALGDYVYDVLPYSDNMEITIKLHWYKKTTVFRYKFILNNLVDTSSGVYNNISKEDLNQQEVANVEGQCLDRLVEVMRTTVCDGVYNYSTVSKVMKTSLVEKLNEITIEGEPMKIGEDGYRVFIFEVDNQEEYRHIEIPFGTNIYDLPSYIQNTKYGVYKGGIGTYQQTTVNTLLTEDKLKQITCYYTYPLYNNTRYETAEGKKLMILAHPTGKYSHTDHTYAMDGDIIKVVVSGSLKNLGTAENDNLNKGETVVTLNPYKITGVIDDVTEDGVKNTPTNNITSISDKNMSAGINNTRYVEGIVNIYKHVSDTVSNNYSMFQLQWDYSNHELLYPGMPVGLLYKDKELGLILIKGTLASTYTKYDNIKTMNSTMLNIMMENPTISKGS